MIQLTKKEKKTTNSTRQKSVKINSQKNFIHSSPSKSSSDSDSESLDSRSLLQRLTSDTPEPKINIYLKPYEVVDK